MTICPYNPILQRKPLDGVTGDGTKSYCEIIRLRRLIGVRQRGSGAFYPQVTGARVQLNRIGVAAKSDLRTVRFIRLRQV